jgi:hypothetical protein
MHLYDMTSQIPAELGIVHPRRAIPWQVSQPDNTRPFNAYSRSLPSPDVVVAYRQKGPLTISHAALALTLYTFNETYLQTAFPSL